MGYPMPMQPPNAGFPFLMASPQFPQAAAQMNMMHMYGAHPDMMRLLQASNGFPTLSAMPENLTPPPKPESTPSKKAIKPAFGDIPAQVLRAMASPSKPEPLKPQSTLSKDEFLQRYTLALQVRPSFH
jgi:hypothetical protein